MTRHIEPYSARQLQRWLIDHDCTLVHQEGSHLKYRNPAGATLFCPDPGSNHPVTSVVARKVALEYNLSLAQLRAEFGYQATSRPSQSKGRTAKVQPHRDAVVSVPPTDVLSERGLVAITSIFRSGTARKAGMPERIRLARIVGDLERWNDEVAS